MISNIESWTLEFCREIRDYYDNYVLAQFERHGYSKEKVMQLAIDKRITTVESANEKGVSTVYIVDDVNTLFIIYQEFGWRTDENDPCHIVWFNDISCMDVAEVNDNVKENMG